MPSLPTAKISSCEHDGHPRYFQWQSDVPIWISVSPSLRRKLGDAKGGLPKRSMAAFGQLWSRDTGGDILTAQCNT